MYKNLLFALMLVCLGGISFVACKKDINDNPVIIPGNEFPIPAATPVNSALSGRVVNENDAPVSGATVVSSGRTTTTDANGIFSFDDIILDKYISSVTVTSPGYYKAFRSFSASETINYVELKLLPRTLSGTVTATSGGNITLSNSTEINFPANGIVVKSTGAAYAGTVNVFATYIDPTRSDMSAVIPGSFMARDGGNLYTLQSTGMIAVDLESDAGEPLQLASNSPALVKMPIPASLLSRAPNTIDTWSLDEQGVWKKEGTAPRVGDHYEMQVTHFSFWNCDVPANAIYLTLHVQDQNGNPLPNTLVKLSVPNNNTWWANTYGRTDSLGNVSGMVPAGLDLNLAIVGSYNCSTPLYIQGIGPFITNTTLTITATLAATNVLTVRGTVYGCGGTLLANGTAFIYAGAFYTHTSIVNGVYTATLSHCNPITSVSVTVRNDSNTVQSNSGSISVSGNSVTIPNDTLCSTSTPGEAVFIFPTTTPGGLCPQAGVTGQYIAGTPLTPNNVISLMVEVSVPGTYSIATNSANGVLFTGSGTITGTGIQTITLTGSGTPVNTGNYTYFASGQSQGIPTMGCAFIVPFTTNSTSGNAVFSLGGPGACSNTIATGIYYVGFPSQPNTINVQVNVTTPGYYNINTGSPVNGIQFSDTGTFTTTGLQTVVIPAYGSANIPGSFTYTLQGNGNIQNSCVFSVSSVIFPGTSTYAFLLTPGGDCEGNVVQGSFNAGVPINGQAVIVTVNVLVAGQYTIATNTVNGITFVRSGSFATTGVQTIYMAGQGTPVASGVHTFTLVGGGASQGCNFQVTTN